MIFEHNRQIGIFLLANIAAIYANGQNYNERGNIHTGIAVDDEDDEYLLNTEYYGWNDLNGVSEVWRWNVEEYPHPQLEYRFCNRLSPSNICDPDRILTRDQANKLDAVIRKLFNGTKCICKICDYDSGGIQIGIALLKNTFQPYIEHQSKIIRSFTENLRSKWNLGQCGNDILIVVATDDRQSYTDVGHATAKYISEDEAYSIFNRSKRHFSQGDYYDGLLQMLNTYEQVTKNFAEKKNEPKIGVALLSGIVVIIVIAIAVILVVAVLLYRRNKSNRIEKLNHAENGGAKLSPSWRHGNIKTMFSTFKSTNDAYQPCKVQDEKGSKLPSYTDDEEVLNLELALPDPPDSGIRDNQPPKQPSHENNQNQDNQTKINHQLAAKDEETIHLINGGQSNRQKSVDNNDVNTNAKQPVSTTTNAENIANTFETFTPKVSGNGLHQTDL